MENCRPATPLSIHDMDSKVLLDFLAMLKRLGKVGSSGEEKEAEGMWKKVEGCALGRLMVLKEKCGQEMDDSLVSSLDFF